MAGNHTWDAAMNAQETLAQLGTRDLDLLQSYRMDGQTIWDAASLVPTVIRLRDLGLIHHVEADGRNHLACRLSDLGSKVLEVYRAKMFDAKPGTPLG